MRRTSFTLLAATLLYGCLDPGAEPVHQGLNAARASDGPLVMSTRVPPAAQLSSDAQDVLVGLSHPILLPVDPELLGTAVLMEDTHFVAWAADAEGISVSLHGTNRRWTVGAEAAAPPPIDQVRGHRAVFSRNEGIRTATWDELGWAWALDIECEDVEGDARCVTNEYVRSLAESLEQAGGAS